MEKPKYEIINISKDVLTESVGCNFQCESVTCNLQCEEHCVQQCVDEGDYTCISYHA